MDYSLLSLVVVFLSIAFNVLWLVSPSFRFRVRMALYLACIVIASSIGGTLSIPFGRTPANHFRIFNIFHVITFWMGLKFELRNMENIVSDEPFVLVANHQTVHDVLGMSYVWPENCVVLLKNSLKYIPGFNLCAFLCNSIYIHRFSKEKAHKAVDNVIEAVAKDKIPIVPVVFSSHSNFYDLTERRFDYGGRVIVEALPPVDSTKFDDVDSLSAECSRLMQEKFDHLNDEINAEVNNNMKTLKNGVEKQQQNGFCDNHITTNSM